MYLTSIERGLAHFVVPAEVWFSWNKRPFVKIPMQKYLTELRRKLEPPRQLRVLDVIAKEMKVFMDFQNERTQTKRLPPLPIRFTSIVLTVVDGLEHWRVLFYCPGVEHLKVSSFLRL